MLLKSKFKAESRALVIRIKKEVILAQLLITS